MTQYFFRCKSNPSGPVLKLDSAWERKEMEAHPDYEEIDAFGEVVAKVDPVEGTIPLHSARSG